MYRVNNIIYIIYTHAHRCRIQCNRQGKNSGRCRASAENILEKKQFTTYYKVLYTYIIHMYTVHISICYQQTAFCCFAGISRTGVNPVPITRPLTDCREVRDNIITTRESYENFSEEGRRGSKTCVQTPGTDPVPNFGTDEKPIVRKRNRYACTSSVLSLLRAVFLRHTRYFRLGFDISINYESYELFNKTFSRINRKLMSQSKYRI